METLKNRDKHTIRFLKWTKKYSSWWFLICTPDTQEMNPSIMKLIIKYLAKEKLYEIIFVFLTVHRKETFVKSILDGLLLEMIIPAWKKHKDDIISKIIDLLE